MQYPAWVPPRRRHPAVTAAKVVAITVAVTVLLPLVIIIGFFAVFGAISAPPRRRW